MRIIFVFLFLTACSTWDLHAPRTVTAPENGGEVSVSHGNRLLVKLPAAAQGSEWRLREPMTMVVMAEGIADAQGLRMTPVRSGSETLRIVELPIGGDGAAQRTLSYQISVP